MLAGQGCEGTRHAADDIAAIAFDMSHGAKVSIQEFARRCYSCAN
jgi:hypothetical protein